METTRIEARDAGLQLLNRLTLWVGAVALGAVGVFAAISAATIPGNASSPTTQASGSSSAASDSTSSSSSSLQASSGGVGSSTNGSGMVVTGASH